MAGRPELPEAWVRRVQAICAVFPDCYSEPAWVGVRWRVRAATVAHLFGGEDQRFRITFRADPAEVMAFGHLGEPYFQVGWSGNAVGILVDDATDWEELGELLTDSYCIQAPAGLAAQIDRPD